MKGQFGPNGALFSGWETRRHNPTYDWCIIQLGTTGTLQGLDVDTANFNGDWVRISDLVPFYSSISLGNEAPAVSVYALHDAEQKDPEQDDSRVR
jgi:allantoicase